MTWSLFKNGKEMKPLVFSNGKTQQDIVNEVIAAIKQGYKFVFIKGVCGTGKSAIALNIAKELGKTSVVVPVKTLQKQYEDDYMKKLKVFKDNGKQLKITIFTGRQNHICQYKGDLNCDDKLLPCTIEIKEENIEEIKKFLKRNPFVDEHEFLSINDVRRKSIAPACEFWSPLVREEMIGDKKFLKDVKRELVYQGLNGKKFVLCMRKPGCGYYDQFLSYIDSDVLVFNSKKYELESLMDRKPLTEVEIVDECDKFLDDLSNEKRINLNRLSSRLLSINNLVKKIDSEGNKEIAEATSEINSCVVKILNDPNVRDYINKEEILSLKETKIYPLLKAFLNNPQLGEYEELEPFYETAKTFENFFDESYVFFGRNSEKDIISNVITVSLEKKLKEFTDKNKAFVMMSGTIHSDDVLQNIFGIKKGEYKIIEAETEQQGSITRVFTKLERNFRHKEFREGRLTREQYLQALSSCIRQAKKPILVHVNSFLDLPSEEEKEKYGVYNVQTREKLKEIQQNDKFGEMQQRFKNKELDVLYSTKCNRGMDFPDDVCNTIVITKYPYPDTKSPFMRILKKTYPNAYDAYYFDKARREFIQRVYRGLRSKEDHVYLLSPDLHVLNNKFFNYKSEWVTIDKK